MEICLEQAIPTYSGGLGVLAGDTLRSAADLEVPMVAVTLLHRKGYFTQTLDADGQQHEAPVQLESRERCSRPRARAHPSRSPAAASRFAPGATTCIGAGGHVVPVFLLDTKLEENSEWDRTLTDCLYGGDSHYRLCQEVVLGMGGAAMLDAMGYADDAQYHMNEGHAALITLTLLERELAGRARHDISEADLERVRQRCIFTTHTPVPAGHDKFDEGEYKGVLGDDRAQLLVDAQRRRGSHAQHDAPRASPLALRERRRDAAPRDLAGDVPRLSDRLDHQRRARAHVDRGSRSRSCSIGAFPSGAATISISATRSTFRSRRFSTRTRSRRRRCSPRC